MDIKNKLFIKQALYLPDSPDRHAGILPVLSLLATLLMVGCGGDVQNEEAPEATTKIVCAPDNGGITLPEGFCATLVIDNLALRDDHSARHIAVAPNGDIYVKTRSNEGGIVALRDTTGDFRADIIRYFSDMTGTGTDWRIFFRTTDKI